MRPTVRPPTGRRPSATASSTPWPCSSWQSPQRLPITAVCRRRLRASGACFLAGTLIFSGLLAILALTGIGILGAVVPVGGVLLLAGWGWLFAAGLQLGSES